MNIPAIFSETIGRQRRTCAAIVIFLTTCGLPCSAFADDVANYFLGVSRDDPHAVFDAIWHGVDPNVKESERGDTGLILALRDHAMKVFDLLLTTPKIDLELSANNGDTALMIACFTDNLPAVQALLDKDAEVNRHGWTPLHYAAAVGDIDIIKLLLDKSAYIDAESPNKTTPIMMAARSGQLKVVKLLIEEGADASLKNEQGMTAVDFAVKNDHLNIAKWLTDTLNHPVIESAPVPTPVANAKPENTAEDSPNKEENSNKEQLPVKEDNPVKEDGSVKEERVIKEENPAKEEGSIKDESQTKEESPVKEEKPDATPGSHSDKPDASM